MVLIFDDMVKMMDKIAKNNKKKCSINKNFLFIINELLLRFPDLDLRFNLSHNSNLIRYKVASISQDTFESNISNSKIEETLYEAIFNIKELASLYDA